MKRFIYFMCACLIAVVSTCSANDQDYETGQQIGSSVSHWARIAAGGNDDKAFWYAQDYNFIKVKTVILTTNVASSVSDPYLKYKYVDTLNKKFKNKEVNFIREDIIINDYNKYIQGNNLKKSDYSILAYVYDKYKTTNYMQVNIHAYGNRPYPGIRTMGDCWIDFKLIDVMRYKPDSPNSMDILFYNDQRLDAVNASKGGLLSRITGRFSQKFNDALEKNPITE